MIVLHSNAIASKVSRVVTVVAMHRVVVDAEVGTMVSMTSRTTCRSNHARDVVVRQASQSCPRYRGLQKHRRILK